MARGITCNILGRRLANRHADRLRLVEYNGIAVGEDEGRGLGSAFDAADRAWTYSLDPRLRPLRSAAGAFRRAIGISIVSAGDHLIVTRRGRQRRYRDRLDANDNGIAYFGAIDINRTGDLVAAADRRCDHWPPAAGSCVGDNGAPIGNGPEHWSIRVQQPVRKFADEYSLARL